MKTYEKNDVKGAERTFRTNYIIMMFLILFITDIIVEATDITLGQLAIVRSILCFLGVILLSRILTINVVKKYQITTSYKDSLRFSINIVIIAVAVLSIFYFLFSLNNNIKEVEDSSEYKVAVTFLGEEAVEEELEDIKKEARNGFIVVWVAILSASAIAVYSEGKILDKYCEEDVEQEVLNS